MNPQSVSVQDLACYLLKCIKGEKITVLWKLILQWLRDFSDFLVSPVSETGIFRKENIIFVLLLERVQCIKGNITIKHISDSLDFKKSVRKNPVSEGEDHWRVKLRFEINKTSRTRRTGKWNTNSGFSFFSRIAYSSNRSRGNTLVRSER